MRWRTLAATLYIIRCTATNQARVRLRRLREPRYLLGSIAGAAYFYFAMFARMAGRNRRGPVRRPPTPSQLPPALQATVVGVAGVALLAAAALLWVLPGDRRTLAFSDAERAFLFTAPVSRRELLVHRLMRSQLGVLFASVITSIFFVPGAGVSRLRIAVSMWLLLTLVRVYVAGVTLARARLTRSSGTGSRWTAWAPIAGLAGALTVVAAAAWRELGSVPLTGTQDLAERLERVTASGLPRIVLWPFSAAMRPIFAQGPGPYVSAVFGVLVLIGIGVAWVVSNVDAFDLVCGNGDEPRIDGPASRRGVYRSRRGWTLQLSGRPEAAFVWKNAQQTWRANPAAKRWLPVVAAIVTLAVVAAAGGFRGVAGIAATVALVAAGWIVVFGPQVVRPDLRNDLENLDLLKTWPVASAAVIRGEILWPVCLMTTMSWLALAVAALFAGTAYPRLPAAWRMVALAVGVILTPALVAAQYLLQNAAAVLFPAWVPQGGQRARGVEVLGQRLILLGGTILSLAAMLVPGALAALVIWFALSGLLGIAVFVPMATVIAAAVIVEVVLATELLGLAYERLDVLSPERHE